jgi:hypothetical protein
MIHAAVINGADLFAKLVRKEIRAIWHSNHEHWAQEGSNHFAEFVANAVRTWPSKNDPKLKLNMQAKALGTEDYGERKQQGPFAIPVF